MGGFDLPKTGMFVGRVWRANIGPSVVVVRNNTVVDITSKDTPTMRDLLELVDPVAYVNSQEGEVLCDLDALVANSFYAFVSEGLTHLLAPCDLQAVKACGVTFARSMVERVIEERAAGDLKKAAAIRVKIAHVIGDNIKNLIPGSEKAKEVKILLMSEGLWSQYLEVGIGPDVEVFSKAQPMSAVGWGAEVGLHPISKWNNPEPEVVLTVNSRGTVVGATLGNDVNLRDVEGRSALLLGKAKDNNASASLGPFIRLFDDEFDLASIGKITIKMTITGQDDFDLTAVCSMNEISRDPADMVKQTIGRHHQYPEGLMLYLGSMFAPTKDRGSKGDGFTHKIGDVVTISASELGRLTNTVELSTTCPEWTFGTTALMRNLAKRNLL
ncbi:MAG: fumarylacetoacetate hydrolase family protein [Octadecabacter sp.]|nr:fumarylacetoacetate hydrolase family protein [Octadecabacter sp.]